MSAHNIAELQIITVLWIYAVSLFVRTVRKGRA